jgi:hypothetical protein
MIRNRGGFFYGLKLVRGAYLKQERERAVDMKYADPTCPTLEATHANYNFCMAHMVERVKPMGLNIMVASHNVETVKKTVSKMASCGVNPQDGVFFGQLLGMSDYISYSLGHHGYAVYKYVCWFLCYLLTTHPRLDPRCRYVPYGPVHECVAYLIRRIEVRRVFLCSPVQRETGGRCLCMHGCLSAHVMDCCLQENSTVLGNDQLVKERRMLLKEIINRLLPRRTPTTPATPSHSSS